LRVCQFRHSRKVEGLLYKVEKSGSNGILGGRLINDRRPGSGDRLDGFQADFAFLLGAGFADPDNSAALGAGHVFIDDKFDHLASPKTGTSAQPETSFRWIDDQARESLGIAVQIDDQAGAPLRDHPRRAATLGDRKAGHSLTRCSETSDWTVRFHLKRKKR
jgi:hypothetical protein